MMDGRWIWRQMSPENPKYVPRNVENIPENSSQHVETDKAKPITKTAQTILDEKRTET